MVITIDYSKVTWVSFWVFVITNSYIDCRQNHIHIIRKSKVEFIVVDDNGDGGGGAADDDNEDDEGVFNDTY